MSDLMIRRWIRVIFIMIFFIVLFISIKENAAFDVELEDGERNNKPWNIKAYQDSISEYYNCDFEILTEKMQDRLYGIWQAKEIVGWVRTSRYQYDGIGHIYIFCEDAWIDCGRPYFEPVYFGYTADIDELSSEDCLNIHWTDERYKNGTLVIAPSAERMRGEDWQPMLKFIIFDNVLVLEESGTYFELKKMAEINMKGNLENLDRFGREEVQKK